MADDQHSQSPPLRLLQQEFPDLRLGHQIKHSGDLIAQQESDFRIQRPCQTEPLQFSAGELRRVAGEPARFYVQGIQKARLPSSRT